MSDLFSFSCVLHVACTFFYSAELAPTGSPVLAVIFTIGAMRKGLSLPPRSFLRWNSGSQFKEGRSNLLVSHRGPGAIMPLRRSRTFEQLAILNDSILTTGILSLSSAFGEERGCNRLESSLEFRGEEDAIGCTRPDPDPTSWTAMRGRREEWPLSCAVTLVMHTLKAEGGADIERTECVRRLAQFRTQRSSCRVNTVRKPTGTVAIVSHVKDGCK
ncbi:hypothetical protein BJ322DRAFT_180169 [Thelephora terrestris]|uniref:Secreted protein n=1 Tax=Thelephora terrestris TaxID=56493 RepID=A0A9P6L4F4_9AGAM|nr:hypothetical protein BJ322DRAFT_180169 [Thelephora terrestris]